MTKLECKHMENWNYPTSVHFGAGSVRLLTGVCGELGISRPLLVTDESTEKLPFIGEIMSALVQAGIQTTIFSDVVSNPTDTNITDGVSAHRNGNCDGVIAIGGGSGIDAGKAIALMVGQTRSLADFEDRNENWKRVNEQGIAPCVAIPTTAGTGSEVGRASVIIDTVQRKKMIIFHPDMIPARAICDPELTISLPPSLTAATGLDAFTHCFEAYCANGYHPMADGIALEGMALAARWLPLAYEDGANIEARTHMMAVASMGGAAFQKGLGAVHAISHAVGAHYNIHHGLTNAVFLPYVMVRNRSAIQEKMKVVASSIGLEQSGFAAVLDWLTQFLSRLGIPNDAKALGLVEDDLDILATMSASDSVLAGNPVLLDVEDLKDILRNAIRGTLPLPG